jgi:hypothetical protein
MALKQALRHIAAGLERRGVVAASAGEPAAVGGERLQRLRRAELPRKRCASTAQARCARSAEADEHGRCNTSE